MGRTDGEPPAADDPATRIDWRYISLRTADARQAVEAPTGLSFASFLSVCDRTGVEAVSAPRIGRCGRTAWWRPGRSQSPGPDPSTSSDGPHSDEPASLPAWFAPVWDRLRQLHEKNRQRLGIEPEPSEPTPDIIATLDIHGKPVGQVAPRFVVRVGRLTGAIRRFTHPHPDVVRWQKSIREQLAGQWNEPPVACPVRAYIQFRIPRPKNHYAGSNPEVQKLSGRARPWPTTRPDLDNLCKTLIDGLVKARVLEDDRWITTLWARKVYTPTGSGEVPDPGATITLVRETDLNETGR